MTTNAALQEASVLEKVVCVHLDIDVPTGKRSNLASDLKLSKVPPAKIMSLGQKQTFPPALVVPMNSARKGAERVLTKHGVRFLGGFAIPVDHAEEALNELSSIKGEFDGAAQVFLRDYPSAVAKWASEAGEWSHAFINAADPVNVIQQKIRFHYRTYKLGAVDSHSTDATAPSVERSMCDQLFHELSVEAAQTFKESLEGKSTLTHNIRRPFERFREKLSGLAFLDPGINSVIDRIDQVFNTLPPKGEKIEGTALTAIQGLCLLLKDPQAIREFAEAAKRGEKLPPVVASQPDQVALPIEPTEQSVNDHATLQIPGAMPVVEEEPVSAGWFGV